MQNQFKSQDIASSFSIIDLENIYQANQQIIVHMVRKALKPFFSTMVDIFLWPAAN